MFNVRSYVRSQHGPIHDNLHMFRSTRIWYHHETSQRNTSQPFQWHYKLRVSIRKSINRVYIASYDLPSLRWFFRSTTIFSILRQLKPFCLEYGQVPSNKNHIDSCSIDKMYNFDMGKMATTKPHHQSIHFDLDYHFICKWISISSLWIWNLNMKKKKTKHKIQ